MRFSHRTVFVAALVLSTAPLAYAQVPADPSGHWEGSVSLQGTELRFEVDIAKDESGALGGTIGVPAQKLKGLPLLAVTTHGRSVAFYARHDQTLDGELSEDGASMSGTFAAEGATLPFTLTRTGDARIEPPLTSARVDKDLEGTWNATIDEGARHVALTMVNHPNGTATGRLINLDQGGLEIPVAITRSASTVTLEAKVVAGSFSGTLNADGTELAGTWTEDTHVTPLTFRRANKQ